jgi:CheY-like chemotaxis protein
MKIIVCDDDEIRRGSLTRYLSNSSLGEKLQIVQAVCADDVAGFLAADYYDALVLDIVIPKRSNEAPSASNGSTLVRNICRSGRLQKPERIIGLTGYLDDIQQYRGELAEFGVAVIEAKAYSTGWESAVLENLEYTDDSQGHRIGSALLDVVTVHGIRTYGEWQARLKRMIHLKDNRVGLHTHKYGYFSTYAFIIPYFRKREINRLVRHLQNVFINNSDAQFVVFSHSFGTFVTTYALKELYLQGYRNVRRLVLSGSVLPSNHDWRFLTSHGVEVVNDCAQDDLVLWMSEAFVLGTGMAGKTGFLGIQNKKLTSRFSRGGHSSYFHGDEYMRANWLPLLHADVPAQEFDNRIHRGPLYHGVEGLVRVFGKVKPFLYLIVYLGLPVLGLWALYKH